MPGSPDRDALEQRTIAAHGLYIAAFARAERLEFEVQRGAAGARKRDLLVAEREHTRRFAALRDLLDALGYVPRGLTARLPPEPSARSGSCRSRTLRRPRHA